ncbi:hypothetical protein Mpet_1456 [Methanolacinia petrolearia DSM 11571]|uniref:Phage tail assembly chaperone-like domain-containing protein n=1 Tax=Methanolacinia petrolearia (strain DSM 11571 / OCM 486 / SEBR 4847) TaxID=679926 RepID=E1RFI5_METP4|nr:tail fiber assembly protein [Methanolacinia petrolearia]ADN36215.1 hypothetical protein Mpet_1456 [Methanolacinia petrolearia DSM 11571]
MTEKTYNIKTNGYGDVISIFSSRGEYIPSDPGNCHYQKFLEAEESAKSYETAYEYTFEGRLEVVRAKRNRKLEESDKYTMPDFPIDDTEREEWLAYRQLLRDLPSTLTEENIDIFEWPMKPNEATQGE